LVLRSKIVVVILLLLVFARGGGVLFANGGEKEEECFCSSNDVYIQRCRAHARNNNERIDVPKTPSIPSNPFERRRNEKQIIQNRYINTEER
tara:strand:+ start:250 stop:525 length:276 start_codon:yes stop_codon:yes gene_type:complete